LFCDADQTAAQFARKLARKKEDDRIREDHGLLTQAVRAAQELLDRRDKAATERPAQGNYKDGEDDVDEEYKNRVSAIASKARSIQALREDDDEDDLVPVANLGKPRSSTAASREQAHPGEHWQT